jgi:hypothetical protein
MPFFIIVVFDRSASPIHLTGGDDWGHGGGCGRVISNLRRLRIRAHSNATGTSRERNFGPSCASFLGAEDGGALLTDFWQPLAAQHIYDTVAADAALQNNRASRAAFYFSDPHRTFGDRNLFRTSSARPSCASGTKTAKRPSFATFKRLSPRISQALCTVSCTGIRASSSLMQMFRSAGLSFNVVVQKPVPGTSAGTTPHLARIPCTLRWRWRFCRLLLRSPSSPAFPHLETADCAPRGCNHFVFSQ